MKTTKRAKPLAEAIKIADGMGAAPGGRRPLIVRSRLTIEPRLWLIAMIAQARREDAEAPA